MNLCDANVWLALAVSGHSHHLSARAWLDSMGEPSSVLFCRATQQGFLRLLTTAAVQAAFGDPPLTNRQAWSVVEQLLEDDRITIQAVEPPGLDHFWTKFALRDSASPKLWMDAYLAAFAVSGGHRLVTIDRAFRQFEGLDLLLLQARPIRTSRRTRRSAE